MNSRHFHELLYLEIERSKRYGLAFSLAYIDLDNFKMINDRFGHTAGDKALKMITDFIKSNLRLTDIVGRLGGDELSILFPETDRRYVRSIIDKLQSGLPQVMQQHHWSITFSIGVMTCENAYTRADDLIKSADKLMYSVKSTGKNAVKYEPCREG